MHRRHKKDRPYKWIVYNQCYKMTQRDRRVFVTVSDLPWLAMPVDIRNPGRITNTKMIGHFRTHAEALRFAITNGIKER